VEGVKQGGNVASYFTTADGRVLHAVPGPVDAATLLREARWVMETHKLAKLESRDEIGMKAFFRKAHAERLRREHGYDISVNAKPGSRPGLNQQARLHRLLALHPLVRIEQLYKVVFEKILGETVSTAPVEDITPAP
jgi:hypothetical protein